MSKRGGESTRQELDIQTLKQVDLVVSDEVLRYRIRKLMDAPSNPIIEFLRHPLVIAVISFFLTGIAGLLLTNYFQEKQHKTDVKRLALEKEQADQKVRQAALINGIQELSRLMYGRQTRACLLYAAIARSASVKEIEQRKLQYDDAFYDWNANVRRATFIFRQAEDVPGYGKFEAALQYQVGLFSHTDKCLTSAVDLVKQGRQPQHALDQCLHATAEGTFLNNDIARQERCIYAITESVYTYILTGKSDWSGAAANVPARCEIAPDTPTGSGDLNKH